MPQTFYIVPAPSDAEIDNSLPGGSGLPPGLGTKPTPPSIWPPNGLPPLPPGINNDLPSIPGVWPSPRPPGIWPNPPDWPIVIPQPPDKPLPPVEVWPPLPPSAGIAGKALILIWIVGVGYRWLVYESDQAQPK